MRILVLTLVTLVSGAACSNKPASQQRNDASVPTDAGIVDSPSVAPPDASCFMNPTTHLEIINACTTATAIYKNSHPPLTLPDGGLPPLPQ